MKTVKFLKTYKHTERRTWHPGDMPTISGELAVRLVKNKVAVIIGEGDNRMDMEVEEDQWGDDNELIITTSEEEE